MESDEYYGYGGCADCPNYLMGGAKKGKKPAVSEWSKLVKEYGVKEASKRYKKKKVIKKKVTKKKVAKKKVARKRPPTEWNKCQKRHGKDAKKFYKKQVKADCRKAAIGEGFYDYY